MRILQISPEAFPWAKTGGLADVAGALSTRLAALGHEVTLVVPLYREIRRGGYEVGGPELILDPDRLGLPARATIRGIASGVPSLRVLAVDVPELFDREGLYGHGGQDHPDNLLRFSVFTRAALLAAAEEPPDLVHAHDWQAALAPVLIRAGAIPFELPPGSRPPRAVMTLHNLAYQGRFPAPEWPSTGLPANWYRPDRLEYFGSINLLKGGMIAADRVTTVSPRYAAEIATAEFGFGLDGVIASLPVPVEGILNGIDVETWDPSRDPYLPVPFSAEDLGGKSLAKRDLQRELGLPEDPDVPLFGFVSRLVEQKGLGLIDAVRDRLGAWPAQFAFVGAGEPRFEEMLRELAAALPNVGARVAFSERLAHLVEGGADFFLMPSAFEPCGLNQMISQRYGTVPVVHGVGGLADSVVNASPEALADGTATGIVFDDFDAAALGWAIETAVEFFRSPATMQALRAAGFRADFSWEASGRRYETLFERLLAEG